MSPQHSLLRDRKVPVSNSPHWQEFHLNGTDDVTLGNNTQGSFCDFDATDFSLQSSCPFGLQLIKLQRQNNSPPEMNNLLLHLLPNDKEEGREQASGSIKGLVMGWKRPACREEQEKHPWERTFHSGRP